MDSSVPKGVAATSEVPPPLLDLTGIVKTFSGIAVLKDIRFSVARSEVHVLFGENGAGKSTLINIIAGLFPPDAGGYSFAGEAVRDLTPQKARSLGISAVFQEFSLAPDLTIEENLFLGREIVGRGLLRSRQMRRQAEALLADLGFDLHPGDRVGSLSRAHQQMVEIAKALMTDVRLLILDEPTASLTEKETERLFELIAALKARGVGIIYVSHRMSEIRRIADRITVLRDGQYIATVPSSETSDARLIELMTGRQADALFPAIEHRPGRTTLSLAGLGSDAFMDVSLQLRAGEITGIAGLVGCGKSELVRSVFGLERVTAGTILVDDERYDDPTPGDSVARGIMYFPADRVAEGLALSRPTRENATVASLFSPAFQHAGILSRRREAELAKSLSGTLMLRPSSLDQPVGSLSGGNRQKVMLMRGLTREVDVFLFDEPTVGIDVGAKVQVYVFLKQLVERGATVCLVSSEMSEILNLSNVVHVLHQGRLAATFTGPDITETNLLRTFFRNDNDPSGGENRK